MGDVLHALPGVTAFRKALPCCHIGWAIEPQWTPLLRATSADILLSRGPQMPVVDRVYSVPAKQWARRPFSQITLRQVLAVRRALRAEHYDICIDLQGAVRSAWIGRMAEASRLVGEDTPREPLARWFFTERIPTTGVHVIEQAREVMAAVLRDVADVPLPESAAALPVNPVAEAWCEDWLRQYGIERFVMMTPGAGWGAKRWPADRYGALSERLEWMGYRTVVNVGPGEAALAEEVCRNSHGVAMEGSIDQLIACIRRARLFLGGDTGPLHLAAALQIPTVGIYGPTDPARNGPHGTRARVLRHAESRRDHTRRSEPEAGLLTITVDDVLEAAQALLQEKVVAFS